MTRRGFLGAVAAVALAPVLPRVAFARRYPIETYSCLQLLVERQELQEFGMPEWENDGHFRAPYLGISRA